MGDKASTPCTEDCLRDTASTSCLGEIASTSCLGETASTPCLGGNSLNPVWGWGVNVSTPSKVFYLQIRQVADFGVIIKGLKRRTYAQNVMGYKESTPCTEDCLRDTASTSCLGETASTPCLGGNSVNPVSGG